MRESHANTKSLPPAGASTSAAVTVLKPTRDMKWRASFAVQLYDAMGDPDFVTLQPWLFATPLQKLQPLVQRFWHIANLGLMEKLLRFVVEHNVRQVAIEGALKGWHSGKGGQAARAIDARKHEELLKEFQERVGMPHIRQLAGRRTAENLSSSAATVASSPTPSTSLLELFTQSSGESSAAHHHDSLPPSLLDGHLKSLAETSAGATPAAASTASSLAEALDEATVEGNNSTSGANEKDSNNALFKLEAVARVQLGVDAGAAAATPLRSQRFGASLPTAAALVDATSTRTRAAAAGNTAQRSSPVPVEDKVQKSGQHAAAASHQRATKRKRASSQDRKFNTPATRQLPVARKGRTKAVTESQEDADDDTSSSSSDLRLPTDQSWRESCAEQFVQLLRRYPYHLTRTHPLEVNAADTSLESATAIVVQGLDMLSVAASNSSVATMQQELEAALKDATLPKAILHVNLSDDIGAAAAAVPEPQVRGAQAMRERKE